MIGVDPYSASIVGYRMRERRKDFCPAQGSVGVEIGIDELSSRAMVSGYERGKPQPPVPTAKENMEEHDVPLNYFYYDALQ